MNVLPCYKIKVPGFRCNRGGGHNGQCRLKPRWWNLSAHIYFWRMKDK